MIVLSLVKLEGILGGDGAGIQKELDPVEGDGIKLAEGLSKLQLG